MITAIERVEILLLVAAVVSIVARRFRLPYTVGLVVAGIIMAAFPGTRILLTRDLIFTAFLPPLVFEAALQIKWSEFRRELPLTAFLASMGVLISAAVISCGVHYVLRWPWDASILLAVLISATDPVSVIATFRDLGLKGRLRELVETESLLNDGMAAVLFVVALGAAAGSNLTAAAFVTAFLWTTFGGILCGAAVGAAALLLVGRTQDHLVEITITTIAAYASFSLAEHFQVSGVLATMSAGIIVGNIGSLGILSERGGEAVESFWEYVGFTANSLIFLLIGISFDGHELAGVWVSALTVILLVLVGRAAAVYGCCLPYLKSRLKVPMKDQHILFWGGLRGALALALALGLPDDFAYRGVIIDVTFAVVAFSVIVQGLTLPPLLKRLGIIRAKAHRTKPA